MPSERLLQISDKVWPLTRRWMKGHTAIYRATGGRIGGQLPGGVKVLLLDSRGRRSGKRRTNPLLYIEDGDNLVIIASKGGFPRHPAWYHNVQDNADVTVQVGSKQRQLRARDADATERKRLWPKAVEAYPGYEDYRERTEREIPVVILEPR